MASIDWQKSLFPLKTKIKTNPDFSCLNFWVLKKSQEIYSETSQEHDFICYFQWNLVW